MTTVQLFAHARPAESYDGGPQTIDGNRIEFFQWDDMSDQGYVLVGPANITFEFPEGWDPRGKQIEALQEKKKKLSDEFCEAVMRIDQQISRLQAIEFTPEPAPEVIDDGIPF